MVSIRDNIVLAVPIQCLAWVILISSLMIEPLQWFLIPPVNNTPAFLTVSVWLLQSLVVTHLIGYTVNRLLFHIRWSDIRWRLSLHLLASALHIVVIAALILIAAGTEDL